MERLYTRNSINGAQVAVIIAALVISVAIGITIASNRISQFQLLMLFFLVPIFIICFYYPHISIYVFLFGIIVVGTRQPVGIKIFGTGVVVSDLLLLLIVPAILVHLNNKKTHQREKLNNPFILVCIFIAFTFALGLARSNYSAGWFVGVAYTFTYMIIVYFWTTIVLDTRSKMKGLVYVLFFATIIAGLKAMLIAAPGTAFSPYDLSSQALGGPIGQGVNATRVLLYGGDIFFSLLIPFAAALFFTRNRRLKIIAVVSLPFIMMGLIISYTRTFWVAAVAGLLFVLIYFATVNRGKNILKVTVIALFVLVIVLVLLTYVSLGGGNLGEAALKRYMLQPLFGGGGLNDVNLISRIDESKVALESLGANIFFGKGMGATYRFYFAGYESDVTGWSHNGIVWLTLTGGIFGALLFLIALFIASRRLIAYRGDVDLRAISVGLVGSMITMLILSLGTNRFSTIDGASFIGLFFGISWIISTSRSWYEPAIHSTDILQPDP